MHEVCIIYSRKDRQLPPALENALTPHWSVWWDKEVTGDFRQAIEIAIKQARCVIPIWSSASRESKIVIDEATFAVRNNVPLLPIFVEDGANAPLGFGSIDGIELIGWKGEADHPGLQILLQKLRRIAPTRSIERPTRFSVGKTEIHSPTFFFSVSSHETRLTPLESIKALNLFRPEALLVSAYDVHHAPAKQKLKPALSKARLNGTVVLLDSGNYEASRKSDPTWTRTKLHRVLKETPHDFAFCHDEMAPTGKLDDVVRQVVQSVERDSKCTSKPVLPIVHAPKDKSGLYRVKDIPHVLRKLSETLQPLVIGIPERELGAGLVAKARTLAAIRSELANTGRYQPLHLLGTGNPLSIAVLSAAGADCFDGLEWCRVVADAANSALYHFEQYDFFAYQTRVAQSAIVREAADSADINYAGKVLFHNMDFFAQFVTELRSATTSDKKLIRFLSEHLPTGSVAQLENALPEVFR